MMVEQELIEIECRRCGEFYHIFSMRAFERKFYNCSYCGAVGSDDDGWRHKHTDRPEFALFVVEEWVA